MSTLSTNDTTSRDPFAQFAAQRQAAAPTAAPLPDADDERIPFTALDEERIASAALFAKLIAILTLVSAGASLLLSLLTAGFSIKAIISAALSITLGLFLLKASTPMRDMARTDGADRAHLLDTCTYLTKYFNLTGVLMVLASVALLLVAFFTLRMGLM